MNTDVQRETLTFEQADKICQEFANKLGVLYVRFGQCGFGRDCSGLNLDSKWLDYRPYKAIYKAGDLNPSGHEKVLEFNKADLSPPHDLVPDAYHKHDCIAVLHGTRDVVGAFSEPRDVEIPEEDPNDPRMQSAVIQLANWILHMEEVAASMDSELFVGRYRDGYQGIQAMMSGGRGVAIGVR
jgi:hypothetical protein